MSSKEEDDAISFFSRIIKQTKDYYNQEYITVPDEGFGSSSQGSVKKIKPEELFEGAVFVGGKDKD